eukprot:INCI20317.1.p1 GENE.INCI20317.1~~INCI20317.1.p1  ORF type:complete len:310 (-),score=51.13 INCI20317.1:274-1203(-)
MDMRQLMQGMGGMGGMGGGVEVALPDSSETVHISSIALLKMLKHGRAGVPLEVMGLMLGNFTDEYTVHVCDVFAMPQLGTGVSVEAVDEVFQTTMMGMLEQTGRSETVVGWYHSHPGFGCWLSGVDVNTAKSFEQLNVRSVAVVVDPVQSVKGKVVIDAFRTISRQMIMMGKEPRQTTANITFLAKPSIQALMRGLNRSYYSMNIDYRKTEREEEMLSNLYKLQWGQGLRPQKYDLLEDKNAESMERLSRLSRDYISWVQNQEGKTEEAFQVENVGKVNPKRHLTEKTAELLGDNIVQCLGTMINTVIF